MALSLYFPCLRLLVTIANLHQYTDRAMMITGLLPVIGPAWLRQGTWAREKKKVWAAESAKRKEKRDFRLSKGVGARMSEKHSCESAPSPGRPHPSDPHFGTECQPFWLKYSCHSIKMEVDSAGVRHSALTKASSAAEIPTQPLSHVTGLQHARTSMMWQCFCATRCLRCECPHNACKSLQLFRFLISVWD